MERKQEIQSYKSYIGKILIRPLLAGVIAMSFAPTLPETSSTILSTLPTTSAESFRSNYLIQPFPVETINITEEAEIDQIPDLGEFRLTDTVIRGIAGYYSRAGCLGCSAGLIMSNGEPLDDSKLTLAASPEIPLNSLVLITNMDNNLSAIAKVADRGGFKILGRIADLTPALKEAIGGDTDLMDVEITVLQSSDFILDNS